MIMNCKTQVKAEFDNNKLYTAIMNSNMSIREISVASGVPFSTLSGILYRNTIPLVNTVIKIANTLKLDIDDII